MAEGFAEQGEIKPFIPAYLEMLAKAGDYKQLPSTKKDQNRNLQGKFFRYFPADAQAQMQSILQHDLYIPQEILTISDF